MWTAIADIPRAIILLLVQLLVLDHLDLFDGWVLPYLYILILLNLPIETPPWAQLLLGLAVGLVMDVFSFTLGLHISACLFLAWLRPHMLKWLAPRDGFEFGTLPLLRDTGTRWYLIYTGVLTLAHHLWLFAFEVWRWDLFPSVLLRTLLSTVATLMFIFLVQLLFYRVKSK